MKMENLYLVLFLVFAFAEALAGRPLDSFYESLLVRRLDERNLGLRFEFVSRRIVSNSTIDTVEANQYETFPKLIDQVITKNVTDLRLVMTRGSWRWGQETLWPSIESGAPGVELWGKVKSIEDDWIPLVRALAGMTCASLDGLQKSSAFVRMDDGSVFAAMPSETVCTENISPWLKLLPCRNRAGLGRLISAKTVVSANYYSLALTTKRTSFGIELVQSLSLVLPVQDSLKEALGVSLDDSLANVCALSSDSLVIVETSLESSIRPSPNSRTSQYEMWRMPIDGGDLTGLTSLAQSTPPFEFRSAKWSSGWGDLRGTFSTGLYNHDPLKDLRVRHIEFIPSFLRPRLDTLNVIIEDTPLPIEALHKITRIKSTLLRGPPATIEFDLILPRGGKKVLITYSFDKGFLFFDEFPPNPNRGFDVPSSITVYNRTHEGMQSHPGIWRRSKFGPVRRATEALLVSLPQPDFSMPYNVITLSSTGFALFFGMLVNISVRRRGDRWVKPQKSPARMLFDRIVGRLRRLIGRRP